MSIPRIIDRLIDIVGPDGVFHQPSDLIVYEYDGSVDGAVDTARPVAVVLPRTAEQVSGVVKLARQEGLPDHSARSGNRALRRCCGASGRHRRRADADGQGARDRSNRPDSAGRAGRDQSGAFRVHGGAGTVLRS